MSFVPLRGKSVGRSSFGQALPAGSTCPRAYFYDSYITPLLSLDADALARDVAPDGGSVGYSKVTTLVNGSPVLVQRATYWDWFGNKYEMGSLSTSDDPSKNSYAYAVNVNGRIVGKSQAGGTTYFGYRTQVQNWQINPLTDGLATLGEAVDINDLDEVVGNDSGGQTAWLVLGHGSAAAATTQLISYPTLFYCGTRAINNKGVVIGSRYSPSQMKFIPVLWWNQASPFATDVGYNQYGVDGNPYFVNYTGAIKPEVLLAINDDNWIVGWVYKNGQAHAILMKPL